MDNFSYYLLKILEGCLKRPKLNKEGPGLAHSINKRKLDQKLSQVFNREDPVSNWIDAFKMERSNHN